MYVSPCWNHLVARIEAARLHAGVGEAALRELLRALHEENHLQDCRLMASDDDDTQRRALS